MFTALCIINILKYKLHLYYVFKQEQGPTKVKMGLLVFTIITVMLGFYFPIVDCDPKANHKTVININKVIQTLYLVFLSVVSFFVARALGMQLKMVNQNEIKNRLYFLEGLIQFILLVRLITSWALFKTQ